MNKCAILKHQGCLTPTETIGNETKFLKIPIENKYKYLGIWFDRNLNFKDHLLYLEEKIKKSMKMIRIC